MHGREQGFEFGILGCVVSQVWNLILGGIVRMARIMKMMLRRLENDLASFDVIKVLRTYQADMPSFATVMTFCSFHPF
jgi:hypothetical protein